MAGSINRYRADLRDISFVLFEQFKMGELLGRAPFEPWGTDEVNAVIKEGYRFSCEVTGPLAASADREGCRIERGRVLTPAGFQEAWTKLFEAGFKTLSHPVEHHGQGAPYMLKVAVEEMLSGSNPAFNMYPGLADGASEVIEAFGTPEQRQVYVERMLNGTWGGTMCLTESQAGSDVGASRASAKKLPDGRYAIKGTKIFISCGDHDLAQNIIHLVLARIEGAAPGTKGLSLFIVPKFKVQSDGTADGPNDVAVGAIEHKMGINGSSTCVLNFGENDNCVGELVGTVEHQGMAQMFKLMNGARIAVGIQSLGVMGTAYLNALDYARERKQGASIERWKDATAPRVRIIEHADVRRCLLDMKARVEGIRALAVKLAHHSDLTRVLKDSDPEKAQYHQGQIEILTPIIKAYASDQAFHVCETGIQVLGGVGYCKDFPLEQACRDAKIFSIYEGTNHIQAMDLVGRKLGMAGGAHLQSFIADVSAFVAQHREDAVLGGAVQALDEAQSAVMGAAMMFLGWSGSGRLAMVPLAANRFLEMMGELAVGWLLLEQAVIARDASAKLEPTHPDRAFYDGKRFAALYFARNVLPGVAHKGKLLTAEDTTALDIPAESFATV
jgi:alkylation response protein AidB-like acyl-CoA dehydrogenase